MSSLYISCFIMALGSFDEGIPDEATATNKKSLSPKLPNAMMKQEIYNEDIPDETTATNKKSLSPKLPKVMIKQELFHKTGEQSKTTAPGTENLKEYQEEDTFSENKKDDNTEGG